MNSLNQPYLFSSGYMFIEYLLFICIRSILGSSPQKLQSKQLTANSKQQKQGSAVLVSDIGIVKRGVSKKEGSSQGTTNSSSAGSSESKGSAIDGTATAGLLLEDSFEKYYNKDLDLEEDQVPVVINELNESAMNFISQEQYEKALILLQKAQTMLDQIQADKVPGDQFIFLLTLHNMAMCYQKLGILEECSICLEACIEHLESDYLQKYFNNPEQPSLKLKMLKYRCKTHMQICALLSQIHKHKDAVFHSNQAIQIAHYLINECKNQCEFYINQLTKKKPSHENKDSFQHLNSEVSVINDKRFSLLEKTAIKLHPIMIDIQKKMAIEDYRNRHEGGNYITGPVKLSKGGRGSISPSRKGNVAPAGCQTQNGEPPHTYSSTQPDVSFYNCGSSNMKNILGYLNQSEWIYSLNIGNIMQISPLTLQDFLSQTAIQLELSREFVLEKMCFLAVSYFCMGTEYRFLHQLKEKIQDQHFDRKDSEYWHGKAVEMAISFLPSESPLVSHILMSYEKHHSPSNMVIPENENQDKYVRIIRQINGIDSCRLQPIIRHHPDGEYRVQKLEFEKINWHKIFKTEEYLKSLRLINKKNLTNQPVQMHPQFNHAIKFQSKKSSNGSASRHQATNQTSYLNQQNKNFTQRDQELIINQGLADGEDHQQFNHGRVVQPLDQDDSDSDGIDNKNQTDDEQRDRFIINKTPSQDMFYKNSRIHSHDSLNQSRLQNRSEERQPTIITHHSHQLKANHSQSIKTTDDQINQKDQQIGIHSQLDKKYMQQHRNSADSEFNNKGHRKLRPAQKSSSGQASGNIIVNEKQKKQPGRDDNQEGARQQNQSLIEGLNEQQSSNSLDEIDFHRQTQDDHDRKSSNQHQRDIPNTISAATQGHRRAKSSIGINRKASAKAKEQLSQLSTNPKLPIGPLGSQLNHKKSSNSQNRGQMLAQIREKNSSSAMAQLQPRGTESGPKIPHHTDQEDILDDMIQSNSTYLSNHQSQPLSILNSENQLLIQKPRSGQSHQQMQISSNKKLSSQQNIQINNQLNQQSQQKRFKGGSGVAHETPDQVELSQQNVHNSSQSQQQNGFMGKRNHIGQATAPIQNNTNQGSRKKQASTINVEELQSQSQPQSQTQPQTTTTIIGNPGAHKLTGSHPNQPIVASSVRGNHIGNMQNSRPQQSSHNSNQFTSGTVSNAALSQNQNNNGFVAGTANINSIDQSSKNTINVYQFGSGVNFNLKLASSGNQQSHQHPQAASNVSRKQYEQIQNALNQMNSIDRQQLERHNNSLDEKSFETGLQPSQGFNQMIIPSASSKRSQKIQNSAGQNQQTQSSSQQQRRKNNSQTSSKLQNFNIGNQYLTQANQNLSNLAQGSQQNIIQAQNEIMNMIKKRDKLNNSALAQIESNSSSRKFTQQSSNQQVVNNSKIVASQVQATQNTVQNVNKIYNQKHSSDNQSVQNEMGSSRSQQKQRRQLSNPNPEKPSLQWNNQSLNNTGASNASNSAQLSSGQRKQAGSLGSRKTSLEQKFTSHTGFTSSHHRQFSDISQQNIIGYKGIGSNLGIPGVIGESGPSGVSLSSKLQGNNQQMSEHSSMPIMSTNQHGARFIGHANGQANSTTSGQLASSNVGQPSDMITQIPSFIQRQQQQQNQSKYNGGVGSHPMPQSNGSNQQKKAQAYLVNLI